MDRRSVQRFSGLAALAMLLSSGALSSNSTAALAAANRGQGTLTMANQPSVNFEDIMPIIPTTQTNVASLTTVKLIYQSLYQYAGASTSGSFDPAISLADAPVFTNGGKTVNITLKPWNWSNGQPVTARDVEFWENLLNVSKATWAEYVPGQYPDNVVSFKVTGERSFSITFNAVYNQEWLLRNNLAWIVPLPQTVWDRTSAAQPVGDYDQTTAGATAVFKYLTAQSEQTTTYTTNALWKVVDGPYALTAFTPSTGYTVLTRNPHYSGPDKPKAAHFAEEPFTSTESEYNALRAGQLDYGYLPIEDVGQAKYFTAHGYHVSPWYGLDNNFIVINYGNTAVGPMFKQLYVRQAMQELVDEGAFVKDILHGYGHATYGPVPSYPPSAYPASGELKPAYVYNPAKAASLLREHGWVKNSSGVLACQRPGTGATDCGTGIARGAMLSFSLIYDSGSTAASEQSAALKSDFNSAGIGLALSTSTFDDIFGKMSPGSSSWDMGWWGGANTGWNFLQEYPIPSALFGSGGSFNLGEYRSATMDADITASETGSGLQGLHALGNYGAQQVANLWVPVQPYQISVIKSDLKGALPQSATELVEPEEWSLGN